MLGDEISNKRLNQTRALSRCV